jgi:hypothetical protein
MANDTDQGSADAEMAVIEQRIRDDRAGYFGDRIMQARYASLIEAKERQKSDGPISDASLSAGHEGATTPPPDRDGVRWHDAVTGREFLSGSREGQQLLAEWGRDFPARFVGLQHEAASLLGDLPLAERQRVIRWFDALSPKTQMTWFRSLARAGQGRRR